MAPAFRLMTRRIPQHIHLSTLRPRQAIQQRTLSTTTAQHGVSSVIRTDKPGTLNTRALRTLSRSHALTAVARLRPIPGPVSISCHLSKQQRLLHSSATRYTSPKPAQDENPTSRQTQPSTNPPPSEPLNSADSPHTTPPLPTLLTKKLSPSSPSSSPMLNTHENIYTLPNFLTTTRIITAPLISYCLLHSQPVLALSLFAYSSLTDLIDGYLARRFNSGTVLGSILDPFADKLLMTLTTITLYSIGTFPWWLALTILGRDAGLLLSALYFRWISLPPPRTLTRYWDFSLPSAEVRPTEISKINTLLQFLLVADALVLPTLPEQWVEAWNLWGVFEGWMGLVAATTVWSGASYLFTRDAIRFIGKER